MNSKEIVARVPTVVKRRPKWKRIGQWLLALLVIWLIGDWGYSQYVDWRIERWAESVPWDADGLAPGAKELDLGEGSVALLCVHGFSDSPQMYRKLAPAWADQGYHCRAIRLPGFGKDVESYADARVEQWCEKIVSQVAELRGEHDQVWIVGHSLGGALTIHHAIEHPSGMDPVACVDGVVLLAPAVDVSNRRSPLLPTRFWHEFSKYVLPFSTVSCSPFEMDAKDPAEREREHRNIFTPRSVVDNTFEIIDHNRGRAGEIEIPCLMMVAVDDWVVDASAAEQYFSELGSESKKLVRLKESGHMAPVDYEWSFIAGEVGDFISSLPTPAE